MQLKGGVYLLLQPIFHVGRLPNIVGLGMVHHIGQQTVYKIDNNTAQLLGCFYGGCRNSTACPGDPGYQYACQDITENIARYLHRPSV